MLCRIDVKSVFKVSFPLKLSLFTEMQFSTDLALMNTQPRYQSWQRNTNDNGGISSCPDSSKGKLLNQSVWLTSLKRYIRTWQTRDIIIVKQVWKWNENVLEKLKCFSNLLATKVNNNLEITSVRSSLDLGNKFELEYHLSTFFLFKNPRLGFFSLIFIFPPILSDHTRLVFSLRSIEAWNWSNTDVNQKQTDCLLLI